MAFPAKFPGRCVSCNKRIAKGEMIEYNRADKSARHASCAAQSAFQREPGDETEGDGAGASRSRATAPTRAAGGVVCTDCGEVVAHACHGSEEVPF